MTDGEFPSSDIYVRSIVEEQVRGLREIIKGVSQKAPLSDDALFLDHLLQMVSLAAVDGIEPRRAGGGRKRTLSDSEGRLADLHMEVTKMEFVPQSLDRAQ